MYPGQTGVKVNAGTSVDRGRMTTNMFRGVATYLSGFNSFNPEWEMRQNTFVPDSRAYSIMYMNSNTEATLLPVVGTYYKIAGTTTPLKLLRFSAGNNRFTYIGKKDLTAKVSVVLGAKSPATSSDFSIAIAKNGVIVPLPSGSISQLSNNQSFQISFFSEIDLVLNDYLGIFIKSNNTNPITIAEMQFQVGD